MKFFVISLIILLSISTVRAFYYDGQRYPDGTLDVQIDDDFTDSEIALVIAAAAEYNKLDLPVELVCRVVSNPSPGRNVVTVMIDKTLERPGNTVNSGYFLSRTGSQIKLNPYYDADLFLFYLAALHEFGHVLGLEHTTDVLKNRPLMAEFINPSLVSGITEDERVGLYTLYGIGRERLVPYKDEMFFVFQNVNNPEVEFSTDLQHVNEIPKGRYKRWQIVDGNKKRIKPVSL